jgi:hypothetical protein
MLKENSRNHKLYLEEDNLLDVPLDQYRRMIVNEYLYIKGRVQDCYSRVDRLINHY